MGLNGALMTVLLPVAFGLSLVGLWVGAVDAHERLYGLLAPPVLWAAFGPLAIYAGLCARKSAPKSGAGLIGIVLGVVGILVALGPVWSRLAFSYAVIQALWQR